MGSGRRSTPPGYPNTTFGRFPTRGECARTGGALAAGQSWAPLPPHFLIGAGEGGPALLTAFTLLTRIRIDSGSSFKS